MFEHQRKTAARQMTVLGDLWLNTIQYNNTLLILKKDIQLLILEKEVQLSAFGK